MTKLAPWIRSVSMDLSGQWWGHACPSASLMRLSTLWICPDAKLRSEGISAPDTGAFLWTRSAANVSLDGKIEWQDGARIVL